MFHYPVSLFFGRLSDTAGYSFNSKRRNQRENISWHLIIAFAGVEIPTRSCFLSPKIGAVRKYN